MKFAADLHIHSNISDGTQTPAELMRYAALQGITMVALTDHDTARGWEEARKECEKIKLSFIPGMEISCRRVIDERKAYSIHLLAYLPNPEYAPLKKELAAMRQSRTTRAHEMVDKIHEDLPKITWEKLEEKYSHEVTIGRPHIADTLIDLGYCLHREEAFQSYLHPHAKYFVQYYSLDPLEAIALVLEAGGVPVIAHPKAEKKGEAVPDDLLSDMVSVGLAGIEVYHREHSPAAQKSLKKFAQEQGIFVTGSSDYHGYGKVNRIGEHTTDRMSVQHILDRGHGTSALLY